MKARFEPRYSRRLESPWKQQVLAVAISLASIVFILIGAVWLFGFVIPWLESGQSAHLEAYQAVLQERLSRANEFWRGDYPTLNLLLNLLASLALILIVLWSFYRLFMYFARNLDKNGHWNHVIAKHRPGSHR